MNILPLWLKFIYTSFMAVLIPVYWHYYGPTNFLYACDLALILTLIGVWTESALLVSMCLVGIGAIQALWVIDYFGNLVGIKITGVTDYIDVRPAFTDLRPNSFLADVRNARDKSGTYETPDVKVGRNRDVSVFSQARSPASSGRAATGILA